MPEWKQEISKRLVGLKLEPTRELEIVEELSQHLEDRYDELQMSGATPEVAYQAALAELPDHGLPAQELQRVGHGVTLAPMVVHTRRSKMIHDLWQDLR